MTVWYELARRVRQAGRDGAVEAAPAIGRFVVASVSPLSLEQVDGDLVLVDGEEDVEVAKALRDTPPSAGDVVLCHRDGDGDWIVTAVLD